MLVASSYAEPRRHPDVFNRENQAQQNFQRQREHQDQKRVHGYELHQAHALVNLAAEIGAHADPVDQDRRGDEERDQWEDSEDHAGPDGPLIFCDVKNGGGPRAVNAENLIEVSVHGIVHAFSVPSFTRPEPHPSGAADEGADDDHQDPQADEAEHEGPDGKAALFVGVVAVAEWVRVNVRDDHQADDYQSRHHDACDPGIEIDQHFLQAEEIPRGLGRVHGDIRVGWFFEGRVKRERPDHQQDRDDDGYQEFHAHQVRPGVDFALPGGIPFLRFAIFGFCDVGVGFEDGDQFVIFDALFQRVPEIERD